MCPAFDLCLRSALCRFCGFGLYAEFVCPDASAAELALVQEVIEPLQVLLGTAEPEALVQVAVKHKLTLTLEMDGWGGPDSALQLSHESAAALTLRLALRALLCEAVRSEGPCSVTIRELQPGRRSLTGTTTTSTASEGLWIVLERESSEKAPAQTALLVNNATVLEGTVQDSLNGTQLANASVTRQGVETSLSVDLTVVSFSQGEATLAPLRAEMGVGQAGLSTPTRLLLDAIQSHLGVNATDGVMPVTESTYALPSTSPLSPSSPPLPLSPPRASLSSAEGAAQGLTESAGGSSLTLVLAGIGGAAAFVSILALMRRRLTRRRHNRKKATQTTLTPPVTSGLTESTITGASSDLPPVLHSKKDAASSGTGLKAQRTFQARKPGGGDGALLPPPRQLPPQRDFSTRKPGGGGDGSQLPPPRQLPPPERWIPTPGLKHADSGKFRRSLVECKTPHEGDHSTEVAGSSEGGHRLTGDSLNARESHWRRTRRQHRAARAFGVKPTVPFVPPKPLPPPFLAPQQLPAPEGWAPEGEHLPIDESIDDSLKARENHWRRARRQHRAARALGVKGKPTVPFVPPRPLPPPFLAPRQLPAPEGWAPPEEIPPEDKDTGAGGTWRRTLRTMTRRRSHLADFDLPQTPGVDEQGHRHTRRHSWMVEEAPSERRTTVHKNYKGAVGEAVARLEAKVSAHGASNGANPPLPACKCSPLSSAFDRDSVYETYHCGGLNGSPRQQLKPGLVLDAPTQKQRTSCRI